MITIPPTCRGQLKAKEYVNAAKLKYILDNWENFRDTKSHFESLDALKTVCENYLEKAIKDNDQFAYIDVTYNQKNDGRYFSYGAMSLQSISRQIRHTIAEENYIDVDIANAHPVILKYMLGDEAINYPTFCQYVDYRDTVFKLFGNEKREQVKKVLLSLINGGNQDFRTMNDELDRETGEQDAKELETEFEELNKTRNTKVRQFLANFKKELMTVHDIVGEQFPELVEKRKALKGGYNAKASALNCLLCQAENSILMVMLDVVKEKLGDVNMVYCFDGFLIDKAKYTKELLMDCQNAVNNKYEGLNIKLVCKPLDEKFTNIPSGLKFDGFDYKYLNDHVRFTKGNKDVSLDEVIRWAKRFGTISDDCGTRVMVPIPKYDEFSLIEYTDFKEYDINKIKTNFNFVCRVINKNYDPNIDNLKKDKKRIPQEDKHKADKYIANTIGDALIFLVNNQIIPIYDNIVFKPRTEVKPREFNLFQNWRIENYEPKKIIDFTKTKYYKHIKEDLINGSNEEFEHFLDHLADMVQKPYETRSIIHLFQSSQGVGKGNLLKLLQKVMGDKHVVGITDDKKYWDSSFNIETSKAVLTVLEEVKTHGASFKNNDKIKGKTGSGSNRVEEKYKNAYYIKNFSRLWMFTNDKNGAYMEEGDRRYVIHNCSNKRAGNSLEAKKYHLEMVNLINDLDFVYGFYKFLNERKYDEANAERCIDNGAKTILIAKNIPNHIKFVASLLEEDKLIEKRYINCTTMKKLYNESIKSSLTYTKAIPLWRLMGFEAKTVSIKGKKIKLYDISDDNIYACIARYCQFEPVKIETVLGRKINIDQILANPCTDKEIEAIESVLE
jgi:rubrerythrin